jgi:hypothetical protein
LTVTFVDPDVQPLPYTLFFPIWIVMRLARRSEFDSD